MKPIAPPMRPDLRQHSTRDIMRVYHTLVTLHCEHILRPSELVRVREAARVTGEALP